MSTASQVPPIGQCDDRTVPCPPGGTDFTLGFTTVYIFIGIPLYGCVMGFAADVYISSYQRRQARRQARARRLSHSHFDRMLALRSATGTDHAASVARSSASRP